jgi:hypothetical protein
MRGFGTICSNLVDRRTSVARRPCRPHRYLYLFAGQARFEFDRDECDGAPSRPAMVVPTPPHARKRPASIHGVREADWNASAIRQAGLDAKEHFRGFVVGVIGLARVSWLSGL